MIAGDVSPMAIAQEALRRARANEINDLGLAAAIMKSALRTIAGEDLWPAATALLKRAPKVD